MDAEWGMEGETVTPQVKEAILFTMAHVPAEEAAELFEKCAQFHPSSSQIKRVTKEMGEFIEEKDKELMESVRAQEEEIQAEGFKEEVKCFAASMDGANVLLKEPGKKKGRPQERPYNEEEEGKSSYRNVMVGSFSFYGEVEKDKHCPERICSKYVSRMPEEKALSFKERFERELKHCEKQIGAGTKKILLMDAHRGLWNYAKTSDLFQDYYKAVDFYHTTEHLSKAAESLFGKGSKEAADWYRKWREKLMKEDDGALGIVRSIRYLLKSRKLSKCMCKAANGELRFFVLNHKKMPYAEFRRNGFPIGSGPVEAACKSLVKTRMCRSGMRWSRKGGEYVLCLRTIVKSGRWDIFWNEVLKLKKSA